MNFDAWKRLGPVEDIGDRLGFDVRACGRWPDFGYRLQTYNDRDVGRLVKRARQLARSLSTGELPVLLAMLHAGDFSWLADELSEGIWSKLDRTHGEHAAAVALAILRQC
ncbi:hypothetical protein ELI37_19875 [Rhizobium leguminosarum]|uniref:hypothetical protein n=1 Tax=Rhizobium leguminosarum TaxID=384 RepID=UPI001031CF38|nr:hypothetical protein [Rhizobium leguminosarum]TAV12598.1 hypothetical protein ELI37_19875 [Rhizobium leguminosarum]